MEVAAFTYSRIRKRSHVSQGLYGGDGYLASQQQPPLIKGSIPRYARQ